MSIANNAGPRTAFNRDALEFLRPDTTSIGQGTGRVRLRTLILLRWLAIIGQSAAVLFVAFALGLEIHLGLCALVIGASVVLNTVLLLTQSPQRLVREWEAAAQLGYDIAQLTALVAVTGGADNPFMLLLIAPVAISASTLRPAVTAGLVAMTLLSLVVLTLWSQPLPWHPGEAFALPPMYRFGLIIAVGVGLLFTSMYAWRVAEEESRLVTALATAQFVLAREQRLSALGGLAAAAAHELGTPLATIHLIATEMERGLKGDDPLLEDARLLVSQSQRCRDILTTLSQRGDQGDPVFQTTPIELLLEEIAGPHRGLGARITISAEPFDGSPATEPTVLRIPEVRYGLGNLIENAVGFAETSVDFSARWSDTQIEIVIRDDGHGFAPDVMGRLGEPYVSDRSDVESEKAGGLGLGVFIAKTLLERSGGAVSFRNRTLPATGAVVRVVWSRDTLEAQTLFVGAAAGPISATE
jgi:two-component system, sensor histidine kinase RegB